MFTHTHLDDGREHVTCARCGQAATRPQGDRRGVDAWKREHKRPGQRGRKDAA